MPNYYLMHVGVSKEDGAPGPGSGRYPLGSGERPYQNKEEARRIRKEKFKTAVKKVASGAGKAAWTGVAVALKVVASTAITSSTIAALGVAGFEFIQSPTGQQLMNKVAVAAGNIFYSNFVAPMANEAVRNFDSAVGDAIKAVGAIDPGTPKLAQLTEGTQYINKLVEDPTAQYIAKTAVKAMLS